MRFLSDIGDRDLPEVGGKAVGLARLAAFGLPVPPAFAVPASFFTEARSRCLDEPEPEALADRLVPEARAELAAALDRLGPAPYGYAIRSSAAEEDAGTASFAGVHDTFLGVSRDDVPRSLFRCWASAFTETALQYRRRMGLPEQPSAIRMGVVVQPMLRPSASGVLFTRDPLGASGDLVIEAVSDSSERTVDGKTRPVTFLVAWDGEMQSAEDRARAPESWRWLRDLAESARRAESEWGRPLDIEWARQEERIYFLQARPITAREVAPPAITAAGPAPGETETLWTRANLRELLPEIPSPLFISQFERGYWLESSRRIGMDLDPGVDWIRVIEGRPYFNLTQMMKWGADLGFSPSLFARALGHGDELAGIPDLPARPVRAFLRSPARSFRLLALQVTASRRLLRFFDAVHSRVRELREASPSAVSDLELLEILREADDYNAEFLAALSTAFFRVLARTLAFELLTPRRIDFLPFLNAVVTAGDRSVSLRQGEELLELAGLARAEGRVIQYLLEAKREYRDYLEELEGTRFLAAFREYLDRYGHRGIHESDPARPVYSEAPGFLLKAIAAVAAEPRPPDPEATRRRQRETAAAAWRDLRQSLGIVERILPLRVGLLRWTARSLKEAMSRREAIRFEGMRVHAELRRTFREAGRRLHSAGRIDVPEDLSWLRFGEIEAVLEGADREEDLRSRIRARKREQELQLEIDMPNLLRESEIPRLRERRLPDPAETGVFAGVPVGPGRVEGPVVVLEGPHQLERVRRGDILVAPTLDPSWIPLFTLAAGLVVEMGGTLSHGSIIVREYGLPAVVNIPRITRLLKTGDRILLDGSAGLVHRLGSG